MTILNTAKGDITIRIAEPEDANPLLALRLEALTLHPEAYAADIDRTTTDGEGAWVERITEYARSQSGAIMIALAGKELIGMSGIVRGHWPKTRHFGTVWGVYVKPAWRGCHIGDAIVNGCIDWATGNKVTVVNLGVITTNTSAIRCYTRCGFTVYGIEPRTVFYDGTYYDDLLMVRLL